MQKVSVWLVAVIFSVLVIGIDYICGSLFGFAKDLASFIANALIYILVTFWASFAVTGPRYSGHLHS
jgi:hypothetical protein